jgi:tryptophan 2,3-dioxygenase
VLHYYPPDMPGHEQMQRRLRERTVVDHFYDFLEAQGATIPPELKNRDLTQPNQPNTQVQEQLHAFYKTRPDLAILFEAMIDFDEGQQEWRYRHVKLVERTIGAKGGTGGRRGSSS